MADNYLENKYAEYQARKTSGTRTGHTTKTLHKTRRVFITGGAEGIGKAIVRAFRGAGHRGLLRQERDLRKRDCPTNRDTIPSRGR